MADDTAPRRRDAWFSDLEQEVLNGYSGLTREAYAVDLRQFAQWCHDHQPVLREELVGSPDHRASLFGCEEKLPHLRFVDRCSRSRRCATSQWPTLPSTA